MNEGSQCKGSGRAVNEGSQCKGSGWAVNEVVNVRVVGGR